MFSCCEISQRASNAYEGVENRIYQIDWYLLPIKIQTMLPSVMLYSQQSFTVRFFGSYSCNRERFLQVSMAEKAKVQTENINGIY